MDVHNRFHSCRKNSGAEPVAAGLLSMALCLANVFPPAIAAGEKQEPLEPPVVELNFDSVTDPFALSGQLRRNARIAGNAISAPGPTSPEYPGQATPNRAARLLTRGSYLVVDDEADNSLDFDLGDTITLEAWVNPKAIASGRHAYVISKGRTYASGQLENHNYALRLTGAAGEARPSFLFSCQNAEEKFVYHRWTAKSGFEIDGGWHHVAITYRFGNPESLICVFDGRTTSGKWDMGGATKAAPAISDEAVWIGSSRGGDPNNSLDGSIDSVRIYRRAIPIDYLTSTWRYRPAPPQHPVVKHEPLRDNVLFVVSEGATSHARFSKEPPTESLRLRASGMFLHRLPIKYQKGGVRALWKGPVHVQGFLSKQLPAGEHELLLRASGKSRLWIDGEIVMETPAKRLSPDAHNPMEIYEADIPWLRPPQVGDRELRAKWQSEGAEHTFVLESLVGSDKSRCEPGEMLVAIRQGDGMYALLTPSTDAETVELTDASIENYRDQLDARLDELNNQLLSDASGDEDAYWNRRHKIARETILKQRDAPNAAAALATIPTRNAAEPMKWLRRLSLDTRGVPPSLEEINDFNSAPAEDRREQFVDRFLNDPRWADHWTSYWQDALAENPNILKPSLNNTGPFRLWIHDSLRLNKPMDRFATELVLMRGDIQAGGPAGFAMAAENDVPMAEKAHIVASAFLGVNMKCARCHDAPYHPWSQGALFEIAAMLKEQPITVPSTSSVPKTFFASRDEAPIAVTLQPGDSVSPRFPIEILGEDGFDASALLTQSEDGSSPRAELAATITHPQNERFPRVVVNRVWTRLLGWGLVDSPDDWFESERRLEKIHNELSDAFVVGGYDFKQLCRTILQSDVYASTAIDSSTTNNEVRYTAVWQRRMTAEQLVDSMHYVCDRELETEALTFDGEASQNVKNFLNLGPARRAWQLTSLSNERDRPSLSLPRATAVAECMEAFGWQGARQSPHSERPTEANVVQPGIVANGHLTTWVTRMTSDSHLLDLAEAASSPDELVRSLFLSVLTREPTQHETEVFAKELAEEFESRLVSAPDSPGLPPVHRGFVTWSNHFDVKANLLRREQERELAAGPLASPRIAPRWRHRAEDALWALVNSPEFQLIQ